MREYSRTTEGTERHGREQAVGCPQRSGAHRACWPLPSLPGRTRRLQSFFVGACPPLAGRPEGPGKVVLRGGLRLETGERVVMSYAWPRRGRTTIATGDQREPVVTDGNVPVPGGGECSVECGKPRAGGDAGAPSVRPLRGRGASSLFHGFRFAPPVAIVVRPRLGAGGKRAGGRNEPIRRLAYPGEPACAPQRSRGILPRSSVCEVGRRLKDAVSLLHIGCSR